MNKGDKIPLTDKQMLQVSELFEESVAIQETIEILSIRSAGKKKEAWNLVKEWFPETAAHKMVFNKHCDDYEIIISETNVKPPTDF